MFDKICLILVIIGALNWGLVGLFEFDLVAWAFRRSNRYYKPYNIYSNSSCRHMVHIPSLQRQFRFRSQLILKNRKASACLKTEALFDKTICPYRT